MSNKLHPAIREIVQIVTKLLPNGQLTGLNDEQLDDNAFIVSDPRSDTICLAIEVNKPGLIHTKDYLTFKIIARKYDTDPYICTVPLTVFAIGLLDFTRLDNLAKELYIVKVITTFNGYISYQNTASYVSMLMDHESSY